MIKILRQKNFLIFIITVFFAQNSFANHSRNLTIFAESNIAIPLTKIAREYSRIANVIVSSNFSSAYNAINNIDSGEPADIFISAHSNWIETLHQKGVVDIYNVGYIAQDQLVLVAQKNNNNFPQEFLNRQSLEEALRILNSNKVSLILDEEGNSSGLFARNLLQQFKFDDIRIFNRLPEDKTSLIAAIKGDKQNYSLLLNSQIYNDKDFQIIAKADRKVFYQALVIAGDNMEVAREFLKFLKSDQAKLILRSHGFVVN